MAPIPGTPDLSELAADARRAPVTAAVGAAAVVLTVARWMDLAPDAFVMDPRAGEGEAWRFLTANLLHGNLLHLLFNLWWLRAFGVAMEPVLGRGRYLLLLGAGALLSEAEYALLDGGIGLSGVVYALFGWLVVRREEEPWAADVAPREVVVLLGGWFFVCIVLTATEILPVANIAHAAGFLAGWLFGLAGSRRWRRAAVPAAVVLLLAVAAVPVAAVAARPRLNFSDEGWAGEGRLGFAAYEKGDFAAAARWWARAVRYPRCRPQEWYNLALARDKGGDRAGAEEALREGLRRDPTMKDAFELLAWWESGGEEARLGFEAFEKGDYAAAEKWWTLAVAHERCRPAELLNLAHARNARGDRAGALEALREAVRRDPSMEDAADLLAAWEGKPR